MGRPDPRLFRLDSGAGQGGAPPQGQEDGFPEGWGTSQSLHTGWMFPLAPGSLPMSMSGSGVGIVPDSNATMPMTSPMTAPMVSPVDDAMAQLPWDMHFHIAPNSSGISATYPAPRQHAMFAFEDAQQLLQPPPPHPSLYSQPPPQPQPPLQSQPPPRVQPPARPRQAQPSRSPTLISAPVHHEQRQRKSRSKQAITSPFFDCLDSFGRNLPLRKFPRPSDGKVNGYIKFSWPSKESRRSSTTVEVVSLDYNSHSTSSVAATQTSNQSSELSLQRRCSASPASTSTLLAGSGSPYSTSSTMALSQAGAHVHSPTGSFRSFCPDETADAPQFLPSHFGHNAVMDNMGRKLYTFYTRNWCPGRSVLTKTNLWLTDFASMQHSPGVLAAIQSLADDTLRRRVNERFAIAEARLSELLQNASKLDEIQSSELVTLASLLSMQDVVLTERRLQRPYQPRWLTGFRQAENVLHLTDPGCRFYKESNVQVSSLRLAQSVIVGRAVILAQPMMPLPPLATFNPVAETSRFGFLLYGSEADMYEIHGGCGFSKRLLHIFSQVAYCSTRMLQNAETPIVPVTAQMLHSQLMQLHQWSGEYDSWEAAKSRPQPIEWIRRTDENYIVQEAKQMTEVTAEAWRLAGMIYLQCRLFRLPRNHYMVNDNIADLAKCISIMPTSGPVFTAQAPLLPVFFLGLLATMEEHIQVAEVWFQQVITTPVRSSVPPLYQALERIQSWMDHEVPLPAPSMELPRVIAERQPWWEHMVSKVQEKESEVLCLT
ncbi:hypothetical protein LLEC1_02265 [Akanthomyces lecanii]|uniref:Transcription factor domain-containing protein n=1 Tax=Cordyceps confragosa TaxID=2714763 RepID=A0A179I043_CORDF|nr:hypothetical protein LLEC1_02265 [Akanthomyces lecanii]